MMVKRTLSSSRRTQATFPSVDSEAVSSRQLVSYAYNSEVYFPTGEGLDVPNRGLEPHFGRGRLLLLSAREGDAMPWKVRDSRGFPDGLNLDFEKVYPGTKFM
jgi:hypothetical protein